MKVGDLVKVKNDTDPIEYGLLMEPNKRAVPPSYHAGICWYVLFTNGKRFPMWETRLEVINESR